MKITNQKFIDKAALAAIGVMYQAPGPRGGKDQIAIAAYDIAEALATEREKRRAQSEAVPQEKEPVSGAPANPDVVKALVTDLRNAARHWAGNIRDLLLRAADALDIAKSAEPPEWSEKAVRAALDAWFGGAISESLQSRPYRDDMRAALDAGYLAQMEGE